MKNIIKINSRKSIVKKRFDIGSISFNIFIPVNTMSGFLWSNIWWKLGWHIEQELYESKI